MPDDNVKSWMTDCYISSVSVDMKQNPCKCKVEMEPIPSYRFERGEAVYILFEPQSAEEKRNERSTDEVSLKGFPVNKQFEVTCTNGFANADTFVSLKATHQKVRVWLSADAKTIVRIDVI